MHNPFSNIRSRAPELVAALEEFKRPLIALSIISGVINLLALTGSFDMLQVYDRELSSHSVPTLIGLSLLALVMYGFQGGLEMLRAQASGRAAAILDRRLSSPVHSVVVKLPLLGTSRSSAQQPMRDVDTIRGFFASGGPVAFLDLPWMPLYLIFVFALHPMLGFLCLAGMMTLVFLTWLTEHYSGGVAQSASRADATRRSIADTNTRNAEVIKAMGLAPRAIARFEKANDVYLSLQTSAADIIANLSSISRFLRFSLQSAILGIGAYLTVRGELSGGAIIAASITTSRALAPVEQIISHWRSFVAARQSFARLNSALDMRKQSSQLLTLPAPTESVSVENATLSIPGTERPVLFNMSFELKRGQALAVIGPSAAGKSSLARALTGVWPLVRGTIRLDGAELAHRTPEELGRHIGYLPQDVTLFEGTISENISRLETEPDSMAIIAAAKAAGVHELILRLPSGYETNVGPDGSALSAGQRQRVALARALFRDPFLVVLDEPNSNLDADGETALGNAIQSVRDRGGIVVVIAHRPSALAAVDHVAMINDGQITAFGPKDDVLKKVLRQPIRSVAG